MLKNSVQHQSFESLLEKIELPMYLTGSRYFGTNTSYSDWDLFIDEDSLRDVEHLSFEMDRVFSDWAFEYTSTGGVAETGANYTGKGVILVYKMRVDLNGTHVVHLQVVKNAEKRSALQEKFRDELNSISSALKRISRCTLATDVEDHYLVHSSLSQIERNVWSILVDPTLEDTTIDTIADD